MGMAGRRWMRRRVEEVCSRWSASRGEKQALRCHRWPQGFPPLVIVDGKCRWLFVATCSRRNIVGEDGDSSRNQWWTFWPWARNERLRGRKCYSETMCRGRRRREGNSVCREWMIGSWVVKESGFEKEHMRQRETERGGKTYVTNVLIVAFLNGYV